MTPVCVVCGTYVIEGREICTTCESQNNLLSCIYCGETDPDLLHTECGITYCQYCHEDGGIMDVDDDLALKFEKMKRNDGRGFQ